MLFLRIHDGKIGKSFGLFPDLMMKQQLTIYLNAACFTRTAFMNIAAFKLPNKVKIIV